MYVFQEILQKPIYDEIHISLDSKGLIGLIKNNRKCNFFWYLIREVFFKVKLFFLPKMYQMLKIYATLSLF